MPIINTAGELLAQGRYIFRVAEVPEAGSTKDGYDFWQFRFEVSVDGQTVPYNERFMIFQIAPLLRALETPEPAPGKFDFEPTMALGKLVQATLVHEVLDRGPRKGEIVARMRDIHPAPSTAKAPAPADEIPF